jgi:hypothetical protein
VTRAEAGATDLTAACAGPGRRTRPAAGLAQGVLPGTPIRGQAGRAVRRRCRRAGRRSGPGRCGAGQGRRRDDRCMPGVRRRGGRGLNSRPQGKHRQRPRPGEAAHRHAQRGGRGERQRAGTHVQLTCTGHSTPPPAQPWPGGEGGLFGAPPLAGSPAAASRRERMSPPPPVRRPPATPSSMPGARAPTVSWTPRADRSSRNYDPYVSDPYGFDPDPYGFGEMTGPGHPRCGSPGPEGD